VAIGFVGILSLLPAGMQASRSAADSTLAAMLVQDSFSELRSQPFNATVVCYSGCSAQNLSTYNNTTSPVYNYYDARGFLTNSANAYYKVGLTYRPQTGLAVTRVLA